MLTGTDGGREKNRWRSSASNCAVASSARSLGGPMALTHCLSSRWPGSFFSDRVSFVFFSVAPLPTPPFRHSQTEAAMRTQSRSTCNYSTQATLSLPPEITMPAPVRVLPPLNSLFSVARRKMDRAAGAFIAGWGFVFIRSFSYLALLYNSENYSPVICVLCFRVTQFRELHLVS